MSETWRKGDRTASPCAHQKPEWCEHHPWPRAMKLTGPPTSGASSQFPAGVGANNRSELGAPSHMPTPKFVLDTVWGQAYTCHCCCSDRGPGCGPPQGHTPCPSASPGRAVGCRLTGSPSVNYVDRGTALCTHHCAEMGWVREARHRAAYVASAAALRPTSSRQTNPQQPASAHPRRKLADAKCVAVAASDGGVPPCLAIQRGWSAMALVGATPCTVSARSTRAFATAVRGVAKRANGCPHLTRVREPVQCWYLQPCATTTGTLTADAGGTQAHAVAVSALATPHVRT